MGRDKVNPNPWSPTAGNGHQYQGQTHHKQPLPSWGSWKRFLPLCQWLPQNCGASASKFYWPCPESSSEESPSTLIVIGWTVIWKFRASGSRGLGWRFGWQEQSSWDKSENTPNSACPREPQLSFLLFIIGPFLPGPLRFFLQTSCPKGTQVPNASHFHHPEYENWTMIFSSHPHQIPNSLIWGGWHTCPFIAYLLQRNKEFRVVFACFVTHTIELALWEPLNTLMAVKVPK